MLGNWIVQTTTTTGAGNLSLAPVTGYPPLSSQFAVGELLSYVILDDATGAPIERGLGRRDGSGNLVRTKPLASMVSGTYDGADVPAVSLDAGVKRVICSAGPNTDFAVPGVFSGGGPVGYGDANPAGSVAHLSLVANTVYVLPFVHAVDADVTAFSFRMAGTTGSVGTLAKVAAYSIGLDGLPDVKLVESSTVAVDSTGSKTAAITRFRPPPRYLVALLTNGTPQVQGVSGSIGLMNQGMGFTSIFIPIVHLTHAGATGLTFPTTWALTGVVASVTRPQVIAVCG